MKKKFQDKYSTSVTVMLPNLGTCTIELLKGNKHSIFQNYSQFANANKEHYRIQMLHHSKKLLHYYLKDEKFRKSSKVTGFVYMAWFI